MRDHEADIDEHGAHCNNGEDCGELDKHVEARKPDQDDEAHHHFGAHWGEVAGYAGGLDDVASCHDGIHGRVHDVRAPHPEMSEISWKNPKFSS